ncbi:KH domain-containing protein [Thermoleophilia bacterium SCSIO 60948]|nr:KH domain-containing protein [Thermoleophilia bacterium SCSIO 60948]
MSGSLESLPEQPADRVRAILERVASQMEIEGASVEVSEDDDTIVGTVDAEDVGILIGRRGATIDAVQLLCYRAAFRGSPDRKRVTVDAGGYRANRRESALRQADMAAERALEAGVEIELEPMSASERRIVHDHLKERAGVETFSEGEGSERCVIVAPLVEQSS